MEIHLSRRRTLSERQRRKKILDPSHIDSTHHEWPMKTRIRIFCPYFEWNESIHLDKPQLIGKGKFSSVLKCSLKDHTGGRDEVDRIDEDEVAVKVLEKSTIISQSMSTQICQERRIQSVCSHHPFVLPLLKVWQDDRRLFMALPLCDRGQLFALWASRRTSSQSFPPASICVAALQLSSALQYVQSLGVIYRDLKLDNVLISRRGDLQISDFGLSKWLGRHERTRTICGTLAYMAPEILSGTPYGHAADWWSLGVLLHCLCTMRFPYVRGPNHTEMLKNILGSDGIQLDESLSKEITQLVKSLMSVDEMSRLTSFNNLESYFSSRLTYEEMVNNGVSFLSTLEIETETNLKIVTPTGSSSENAESQIPPESQSDFFQPESDQVDLAQSQSDQFEVGQLEIDSFLSHINFDHNLNPCEKLGNLETTL